jgi:hypothetical protein
MPTVQAKTVDTHQAPSAPPSALRLGALLGDYRAEARESAKTVTRRSALSVVEMAQLELGRADLNPDQIANAVAAYAVPRLLFPEGRSQVRVDLPRGSVSVRVSDEEVVETSADRTLLTYLELYFAASHLSPTTSIPFTALDLGVLRLVLSSRRDAVTHHLETLVGPPDATSALSHRRMRGALLLLAAAVTALAAVIAVHEVTATKRAGAVLIETQIIDALVITRADVNSTPTEPAKDSK